MAQSITFANFTVCLLSRRGWCVLTSKGTEKIPTKVASRPFKSNKVAFASFAYQIELHSAQSGSRHARYSDGSDQRSTCTEDVELQRA